MRFVHNKIYYSGLEPGEVGLVWLTPDQAPLYKLVKQLVAKHGAYTIPAKWMEDELV